MVFEDRILALAREMKVSDNREHQAAASILLAVVGAWKAGALDQLTQVVRIFALQDQERIDRLRTPRSDTEESGKPNSSY